MGSRTTRSTLRLSALLVAWVLAGALALSSPLAALGWVAGQPLATPYPRLGMWWPNTTTQSAAQLSRYDWMVLGEWDRPHIASIRALNPGEILLNSTSASEIDIDSNAPANDPDNAEIAAVPTSWLLTQAGADLTAPAAASATTFAVSVVSRTGSDGKPVELFVAGDLVVVGDELARVQSVNAGAHTLTVRRGIVKPAAAHAIGTRVAAAVSFWPDSVVMDLSGACPRATVDASAGPETWAEYNARRGAALATDDAWDGILVDRSDGNESWLVGNSTARSIDPDRSNRIPTDYSAFDSSWNTGLLGYELRLRAAAGDGKLIMTNWGYPNFDVLNGNNFEGFPNVDQIGYAWQEEVVGPSPGNGSYFEWLAKSRQPNLTTIETYQDDSGTSPTGDGSYDNPATHPGFVPNYKKMRYGLTTALMGDGFFSYEINTNGHGSLGLLWFDEYDGAGRGRGYLGQPTAPAHRVWDPMPTPDLVGGDGSFDTAKQFDAWEFDTDAGAVATAVRDTATTHGGSGSMRVKVTNTDGVDWHADATHPLSVQAGREYTVSFWARSDATHSVDAWIQQAVTPWDDLVYLGPSPVTPQWHHFVLTATSSETEAKAEIVLAFGTSAGTVWVDDVSVQQGDPDVWIRTFTSGAAIVNATGSTANVPLGRLYRKLLGSQDRAVNDGHLAGSVTVSPHDGIVLVTTADTGSIGALLAKAVSDSSRAALNARKGASAFAKQAKHSSRTARKRSTAASAAWKRCAEKADALTRAIRTAQVRLAGATVDFPQALSAAVSAGATASRYAAAAYRSGRTAPGRTAVSAISAARSALRSAYTSAR